MVSGEVRHPGEHVTNGETHLRDAVYLAGGVTRDALLNDAALLEQASKIPVPAWRPKSGKRVVTDESKKQEDAQKEEAQPQQASADEELLKVKAQLKRLFKQHGRVSLRAADFEKDDDKNHHIDFITYCSNLRATNYKIKTASRHECKMIAGKIIPAIASTTAAICGLVELELFKLALGSKVDNHRDCNLNLAMGAQILNFWSPVGPPKTKSKDYDVITLGPLKAVPEGFTLWDSVVIKGGRQMTLQELIDTFKKVHHGCEITIMTKRNETNPIFMGARSGLNKPVVQLVEEKHGPLHPKQKFIIFDVAANAADETDAVTPWIKFFV